jgi:hypothetical protein
MVNRTLKKRNIKYHHKSYFKGHQNNIQVIRSQRNPIHLLAWIQMTYLRKVQEAKKCMKRVSLPLAHLIHRTIRKSKVNFKLICQQRCKKGKRIYFYKKKRERKVVLSLIK